MLAGIDAAVLWLAALELAGTGVFALAMLAEACLRRRSAATRRGVWALAIGVALALPLARLALAAPTWVMDPWLASTLLIVWAAGAAALLLRLMFGVMQARRLRDHSEPLRELAWHESLAALRPDARPMLRISDELVSPVVLGVWRPVIVVPRPMLGAPATGRRSLLAHELAHVAHADALLRVAGSVALAIYWPSPLAWVARRRLRATAEHAADDAVLQAGVPCASYAAQLVAVARAQLGRTGRVAAGGLRARVCAVLDVRRVRAPARVARWGLPRLAGAAVLLASLVTACEARPGDPPAVAARP